MNQNKLVNKGAPLQNTENIRTGKANVQKQNKGEKLKKPLVSSASQNLSKVSLQSTIKILKHIDNKENERPNLNELLDNKVNSPTTNKMIKHKKSEKLNTNEVNTVFKELVSANLNKTNLIESVEVDLQKRATNVKPLPKEKDPMPDTSNYFDIKDYITAVTAPARDPVVTNRKSEPYKIEKDELISDTDRLFPSQFI